MTNTTDAIRGGDRAALARAITLVESKRRDHRLRAAELIQALLPHSGQAVRIGISGVPGAGKSTLIDALGTMLIAQGHRVAVLAVDPTSSRTGGSILGDKTRMGRLAASPHAYIRPSPSGGTLGGVAARTRETMLLCEAAGFDVVIVETVGVGQSETAVADMTDFFLVLMLPGGGDELQGIKKGIVEIADAIAINKADGAMEGPAKAAAAEYRAALHILAPSGSAWKPQVTTVSALTGHGIPALWEMVGAHQAATKGSGEHQTRRHRQDVLWMWRLVDDHLRQRIDADADTRARVAEIEAAVAEGTLAASLGAGEIVKLYGL